jgi:hypothetical protein
MSRKVVKNFETSIGLKLAPWGTPNLTKSAIDDDKFEYTNLT